MANGARGGVEKHLKGILRPVSQAIPPRSLVCLTKHQSKPTLLKGRINRDHRHASGEVVLPLPVIAAPHLPKICPRLLLADAWPDLARKASEPSKMLLNRYRTYLGKVWPKAIIVLNVHVSTFFWLSILLFIDESLRGIIGAVGV